MKNSDMNVTKKIMDCVIDDLEKVYRNKKKTICGIKNHTFYMRTWGRKESEWDYNKKKEYCTTVACLWGTGYLSANGEITSDGPSYEWCGQSEWHEKMRRLFHMTELDTPDIIVAYRSINKRTGKLDIKKLGEISKSFADEYINTQSIFDTLG